MSRNILKLEGGWPMATMLVVTIETICFLVLESLVLHEHILQIHQVPNGLSTPNVIYPILYMLAIISVFCLCADAMYHRNQIQVVAFTFFNFLCCLYGILQTTTDWQLIKDLHSSDANRLKAYDIAVTVTVGVCTIFLSFAAYKLAAVFGWEMYRFLGADLNMKRMHKGYEILITLLKFDVFFFIALAIQIFALVSTAGKEHLIGTLSRQQTLISLSIPASIILLALAFFGVMKENKVATIFVMISLVVVEPYFIYQLVTIYDKDSSQRFENSFKYLTFFISVTMVLVLVTLFFMIYCFRNFGKGLLISEKSKITKPKRPFEIDGDVEEYGHSIPLKNQEDDASERLMAYPALKKIQQDYHILPSEGHGNHNNQNLQSYNDKMEIE